MIRAITPADSPAVAEIAIDSGLFSESDDGFLNQMMSDYFALNQTEGHQCVIDMTDRPLGVAYFAPAKATAGTWYLTMIAVVADQQGLGRGAALMRHVEEALRSSGERLLLVETSGQPTFEQTRTFYKKCGYTEEARVRDYYSAGDDMVLFRKALSGSTNAILELTTRA